MVLEEEVERERTTREQFQSRLIFLSISKPLAISPRSRALSPRPRERSIRALLTRDAKGKGEERGCEKLDAARARLEFFNAQREQLGSVSLSLSSANLSPPVSLFCLPLSLLLLLRRHRKGIIKAEREREKITGKAGRRHGNENEKRKNRWRRRRRNRSHHQPFEKRKKKTHQQRSRSSQDRLLARVPRLGPRDDAEDGVLHLAHGVSGPSTAARPVAAERRVATAHASSSSRAPEGRASGSATNTARAGRAVPARASAEARRRRRAPELVHRARRRVFFSLFCKRGD